MSLIKILSRCQLSEKAVNLNLNVMITRYLSVQKITKNLKLITNEPRKIETDLKTLRLTQNSNERPLALLFTWLMAKPSHQSKFANLYLDQDFDVLLTESFPAEVLWPTTGSQKVASDISKFLINNEYYDRIVIHGFSVAGYLWGEVLNFNEKEPAKFKPVIERIKGQIWDSIAHVTEIPVGVSKSVFLKNAILQKSLENSILMYMKVFYKSATRHYINAADQFFANKVHSPALVVASKTDQIGTEWASLKLANDWTKLGVDVKLKIFDKSPHCGHFAAHKDEYLSLMFAHLKHVNMLKHP